MNTKTTVEQAADEMHRLLYLGQNYDDVLERVAFNYQVGTEDLELTFLYLFG